MQVQTERTLSSEISRVGSIPDQTTNKLPISVTKAQSRVTKFGVPRMGTLSRVSHLLALVPVDVKDPKAS